MNDSTICNLCNNPGTLENAFEKKKIPSNIRKFKDNKFTVWRCSSCNSLHSKEAINLDYYYQSYIAHQQNLNFFWRTVYYNRLKLLRQHGFTKSHQLLDYGCGQGMFITFLNQLGYDNVYGYDPYTTRFSDRKIISEKYDFITSYDVIEHVEEPRVFLAKVVSCLESNGLLILGTPNAEEIELSAPAVPELHQPFHRHILSKKVLTDLALEQRLKVVFCNNRWFVDTFYPLINGRFLLTYVQKAENVLDVLDEPFRFKIFLAYPLLFIYIFAGYFFRWPGNMTVVLAKGVSNK